MTSAGRMPANKEVIDTGLGHNAVEDQRQAGRKEKPQGT